MQYATFRAVQMCGSLFDGDGECLVSNISSTELALSRTKKKISAKTGAVCNNRLKICWKRDHLWHADERPWRHISITCRRRQTLKRKTMKKIKLLLTSVCVMVVTTG